MKTPQQLVEDILNTAEFGTDEHQECFIKIMRLEHIYCSKLQELLQSVEEVKAAK